MRSFKQVFHQTPYQYLTHLRLERAKRLLNQISKGDFGEVSFTFQAYPRSKLGVVALSMQADIKAT
jgi:AraC-like DNA-binding protein